MRDPYNLRLGSRYVYTQHLDNGLVYCQDRGSGLKGTWQADGTPNGGDLPQTALGDRITTHLRYLARVNPTSAHVPGTEATIIYHA